MSTILLHNQDSSTPVKELQDIDTDFATDLWFVNVYRQNATIDSK